MPHPVTWSDADTAALEDLWAKGLSASQISRALDGRHSRNAVLGKANRMGLEARDNGTNRGASFRTGIPGPKQKTPVPDHPEPSGEILPPIGPKGYFPDKGGCLWPVHRDGEEIQFCGHPRAAGKPYCGGHYQQSKPPGQPKPMLDPRRADRVMR